LFDGGEQRFRETHSDPRSLFLELELHGAEAGKIMLGEVGAETKASPWRSVLRIGSFFSFLCA
jgi:hypothetical protein